MSSSVGANYCSSNVFVSLRARTIVLFLEPIMKRSG